MNSTDPTCELLAALSYLWWVHCKFNNGISIIILSYLGGSGLTRYVSSFISSKDHEQIFRSSTTAFHTKLAMCFTFRSLIANYTLGEIHSKVPVHNQLNVLIDPDLNDRAGI